MGRLKVFTKSMIMNLTENGRDVFEMELGCIPKKNISSPLRSDDVIPSFQVKKSKKGVWGATDHNGHFTGDAIQFVAALYNITYNQAIDKIAQDLNLTEKTKTYVPIKSISTNEVKEKKPVKIDFIDMPFKPPHHAYWNKGHLEEPFLRINDVYAVRSWQIDGTSQRIEDGEIVFAYYAPDIDEQKILRIGPNVNKLFKWRTTAPNTYLWDYYNLTKKVKDLFVVKSRKDQLIIKLLGYDSISVQNESSAIFLNNEFGESNVSKVLKFCDSPIINFGSDPQGVKESKLITEAIGCRWFNTQKQLLKYDVNDNFGFVSEFGLSTLDKLIKLKLKK